MCFRCTLVDMYLCILGDGDAISRQTNYQRIQHYMETKCMSLDRLNMNEYLNKKKALLSKHGRFCISHRYLYILYSSECVASLQFVFFPLGVCICVLYWCLCLDRHIHIFISLCRSVYIDGKAALAVCMCINII